MRHQLSITINGERRDEVVLATAEPPAGVTELTVIFDRTPNTSGVRFLRMMAGNADFSDGAYHFRRWHAWPESASGAFRARGVLLHFGDGNSVEVPVNDEIVVDIQPAATERLPVFAAR